MGLRVHVHRMPDLLGSGNDCTNGGISATADTLVVVNVEGPFNPTDANPAAMLVAGPYGAPNIVPAVLVNGEYVPAPANTESYAGPMMGGNYAASSDSRWGRAVRRMVREGLIARGWSDPGEMGDEFAVPAAVPIHDRFETWATYEALSR